MVEEEIDETVMNYCRPRLPVCQLYLKTARPDKRQEGTRSEMFVNSMEHKFQKSPRSSSYLWPGGVFWGSSSSYPSKIDLYEQHAFFDNDDLFSSKDE